MVFVVLIFIILLVVEPKGLVMGHEFAGEVLDPGDRNDLKIGQRVTGLPISPCLKCDACKSGNPQYCRSTWADAFKGFL